MEAFFNSVIGFLDSIGLIIQGIVQSVAFIITYIFDVIPSVFTIVGYLPAFISSACLLTLSIAIIKTLGGKQ